MQVKELAGAIAAIQRTMVSNKDYLIELDQQNGDGDLGISMAQGYSAIASYLSTTDEEDIGRALLKCSSLFNEAAPSTLGTITSFGFMGMAKALKGKREARLSEWADALDAGLKLIMDRAKSKAGDKTILDALIPGVEALKENAAKGKVEALAFASAAAAQGSEATRAMKSIHGRAAYYGDKSIGIIDGGSVVGRLIFESLAAWALASNASEKGVN
ncbi:MAG: dihydroxyacetone kinase subunit L [Spirochaetales bacterium]|jgi:dihydroxyacetone kinase-like protein